MKILVLNGSPRKQGNTAAMVSAFVKGAEENHHEVDVVNVCQRKIFGCMACEYCHQKESGHERQCVQKDDMQTVYPLLDQAEMIVLASPIYYHGFSGQLQCAVNRIYALDKPKHLKKAALILSSGSDHVYSGAIYEYQNSFLNYLKLEDMGIYTFVEERDRLEDKAKELYQFGKSLEASVTEYPPVSVKLTEFLQAFESGEPIRAGSDLMRYSGWLSHEAMRLTTELNSAYHTPDEIRKIFSDLTGKEIDDGFSLFPPFYTDCGKNITVGKGVFINSGCRFQDQGGIRIGDGTLIGHGVTLATLNHGITPEERHDLYPAPIHIGKNVWIGANVTVLPGVTIGDDAVIGAGAVVTKDIPDRAVAVGVPAKVIQK